MAVCSRPGCNNGQPPRGRYCRSCNAAYQRRWRKKKKAEHRALHELAMQRLADKYRARD